MPLLPVLIQINPNSTIIVSVTVGLDLAALNLQLFFTIVEQLQSNQYVKLQPNVSSNDFIEVN